MSPLRDRFQEPQRTCIGCRRRRPQGELVRLRRAAGGVALDLPDRRGPGRGAYVCANMRCWELARKRRSLARALRLSGSPLDQDALGEALAGMISSSARGGPDPTTP